MAASVLYIHPEFDDIYFQYNILCLHHISISSFISSLSVLLKLLKRVKLIVFENVMNVKQNTK